MLTSLGEGKRACLRDHRPGHGTVKKGGAGRRVWHYVYFKKEARARRAADLIVRPGYEIERISESDNGTWLVLVLQHLTGDETSFDDARELAASVGGEYDGWEMEVARKG